LRGKYIPTKKNGVVKDLYPSLGFNLMNELGTGEHCTLWCLDLANYTPHTTFIARQASVA